MIEIAEALRLMVDSVKPPPTEWVSLEQALGRVLREPATATIDLPPFRQSAMDGYAIRTADTRAASEDAPVSLQVIGEVAAGVHGENHPLAPGQCCRIFTGGRVPDDADAVLPQEIVTRRDSMAVIREPSPPGRNVRGLGEELARGSLLMEPGGRLTPAMIGALGAAGVARVGVGARPRVRVLITGNEITEPGEPLPEGGVYDANGPTLRSYLRQWDCEDFAVERVPDDRDSVERAMREALAHADVVVTTGGVSVGDHDLVVPTAGHLGLETIFWKVAQKPGKPLFLARSPSGVPLLGLPGNPAAVVVGVAVYLRRLLAVQEGEASSPLRRAPLAADLRPDSRRDCWVRARKVADEMGCMGLEPLGRQASHMMSNLFQADALLLAPAGDAPLPAGTAVQWLDL